MNRLTATTTLAVLVGVGALSACTSSTEPPPDPSAPSAVVVTSAVPPPPGALGEPTVGITTLTPVPVNAPANFGNGLIASVTKIDSIERLEARGPGEVAGPGVRVTVSLRNETSSIVDMSGITVNASYGPDSRPASDNSSPPAAPFRGNLDPGASGEAVYLFQVPAADESSLVVEINWNGSPNVVLVRR